jgi:hypothetical protein
LEGVVDEDEEDVDPSSRASVLCGACVMLLYFLTGSGFDSIEFDEMRWDGMRFNGS